MIEKIQQAYGGSGMTAYITHTACLGHNMGEGHPEGPERLAAIKDRLMAAQVFDFLNQVEAPSVSASQLARVHPPNTSNIWNRFSLRWALTAWTQTRP